MIELSHSAHEPKIMRDKTRTELETDLVRIQTAIDELKASGDYYLQSWVSTAIPQGKKIAYPRVQSRLRQFDGKRVRHIRKEESIAYFQACCDRGQKIGQLQRAIDRLNKRLCPTQEVL